MDPRRHNLDLVATAATGFGGLGRSIVFLGGATTSLFITDTGSSSIRPTRDVDVVVEVASLVEYQTTLRDQLLRKGFTDCTDANAPPCRWVFRSVRVDIMPPDPSVLGFSNRWYPAALKNFSHVTIPRGPTLQLVNAPYFLGTKLEAFRGRGGGDYRASHDLEDFVTVIDGRTEIVAEVAAADDDLKGYFRETLGPMLADRRFLDAVPGHLAPDMGTQRRLSRVLDRLDGIARSA